LKRRHAQTIFVFQEEEEEEEEEYFCDFLN
jgi:hypothetical protein